MSIVYRTIICLLFPFVIFNCAKNDLYIFTISPHPSDDGKNFTAFYGGYVEVLTDNGTSNSYALDILTLGSQGLSYSNDSRGAIYIRIPEGSSYNIILSSSLMPRKGPMQVTLHLANSFIVHGVTEDTATSAFNDNPLTPTDNQASSPHPFVSSGSGMIRDFRNYRQYTFSLW